MQAKVREANDEANNLREQLEEVEDEKTAMQKVLSQTQIQVRLGEPWLQSSSVFNHFTTLNDLVKILFLPS